MSDERLTKDVRDRLREMMTSHILNGDSVLERALNECDDLERERDAWRRKYKAQLEANDLLAKEAESRRGDLAGLAERESGGES